MSKRPHSLDTPPTLCYDVHKLASGATHTMFKQLSALFSNTQDTFTEPDTLELNAALTGLLTGIDTALRNGKDELVLDLCDMLNQVLVDYIDTHVAPVHPHAADVYRAWVGKYISSIIFQDAQTYETYAAYIDRVLKIGEKVNA